MQEKHCWAECSALDRRECGSLALVSLGVKVSGGPLGRRGTQESRSSSWKLQCEQKMEVFTGSLENSPWKARRKMEGTRTRERGQTPRGAKPGGVVQPGPRGRAARDEQPLPMLCSRVWPRDSVQPAEVGGASGAELPSLNLLSAGPGLGGDSPWFPCRVWSGFLPPHSWLDVGRYPSVTEEERVV